MGRALLLAAVLACAPASAQVFGGGVFAGGSPQGAGSGGGTLPASLVGVGDSIMNGYGVPSPIFTAVLVLGPGAYAVNAGYAGEKTDQISARWLSSEPTICGATRCTHAWFEGSINDFRLTDTSPATAASNMTTAVDDALSKGYVVAWSDDLPCRGDVLCTEDVMDKVLAYNALMATACSTPPRSLNPRLRCFFAYSLFVDPARFRADGTTLAGYLLPFYSRDELHLSAAGSEALGALAGAALMD